MSQESYQFPRHFDRLRRMRRVPDVEDERGVRLMLKHALRRAALGLVTASLVLAAAPRAAADEPRVVGIGLLANEATPESGPVLRRVLRDLGWVEGQNSKTWYRYAKGRFELFRGHAQELLRVAVRVIVAEGPLAIEAARQATKTVPIVVATTDDPVANGLVASARRPGGNLTGLSLFVPELARRRLELLKHAVPRATRVAVLWNPSNPTAALELEETQVAARTLGVELAPVELREDAEFRAALDRVKGGNAGALVVLADTVTVARRRDLEVRGKEPATGGLSARRVRGRRRSLGLRSHLDRGVPQRGDPRRPDPPRRPTCGACGRAADAFRASGKPPRCKDARPRHPLVPAHAGGPRDPVRWRDPELWRVGCAGAEHEEPRGRSSRADLRVVIAEPVARVPMSKGERFLSQVEEGRRCVEY